jgi:hypothetical protein
MIMIREFVTWGITNSNKSGEKFISNFHHLIHLILNLVKYLQIGQNVPITAHKFEF